MTRRYPLAASGRAALATVGLLGAMVTGPCVLVPAAAAPLFELADRSEVIVRGTVEGTASHAAGKLLVFTIVPHEVLKGPAKTGTPLKVVQDKRFESDRPYFEDGVTTLIFAVPLPAYSYYREALPPASYLGWTDGKDPAVAIAALRDAALVTPLAGYLGVRDDPPAAARHLARVLAGGVVRLRADALLALEARPELVAHLDAEALAPLDRYLGDDRIPAAERGETLVRLARLGAPGIVAVAEPVAASTGPLQAAAVEALVIRGRSPGEKRLVAYSRSDDAALRLAAVRGLARGVSAAAFDRLAELLESERSAGERIAVLRALGDARDDRAVPLLAAALRDEDKSCVNAAADSLGRIASAAAIDALTLALTHGSFAAQAASAFALERTNDPRALEVLHEQLEKHPDEDVRRVILLAIGGAPDHEH